MLTLLNRTELQYSCLRKNMSTPRRAPPGPPTPPTTDSGSSPSSPTVNIEDKYYVGLSNTPSANSSSPAALEPKQPPPSILSQGPQEVASWYQQEAARLHQHANLSQQRNQMLVQKVLAMRRQLAAPSISTTTPSKSSGHKDTRTTTSSSTITSSSGSSTTTNSPSTYLPSASFPPSPSPAAATDSATDSTTSSTFTVRELDDSPMHQLHQHTQPSQFNSEDQGTMNDLAWTELKLQRSHHNFHALSKRTRQVETSNANAASMIVDLRHALEVSRVRTEEMTRREQEGRSLVSQLSNHVDSLKKQTQLSQEKITVYEQVKNEAEERATKWKKERREIGGYALRLEKETEQVTAALQRCQKEHQTMKGELEETRGAVREMHGKLKAQAETSRLQLSNVAEIDPLHRSISSSVLALKRETQRDHQKSILHVQHELEDVRERLDAQTNQLQEANTRNEVLTVRASHAQRLSEEYREKSRKLQEIMTSGASVQESDRSTLLSKVATLESQLLMSQKESERCHVELTSVLSAMETARDRLLQSSESKDHVERQCDQLRQAVKDAESKTRVFTTRYDVLNEDCLASKKEIGALQADTVHLEQQLMATQRKLSAAQQSESTSNLTRNSFEKQLDTAQQHIQEARTKVNHCEAKLHTAENEVYRAKTEMEEERRITERRREQTAVATQKQDTLLAELLAKHQHELEEEQHINNALRSEIAQVTTESLYVAQATAANATTDASTVLQYKKEMNDMCDEVRKKEESHAIVVERLAQQKLDAVGYREHIEALKKTNTGMVLQMKDMEETMMIKVILFLMCVCLLFFDWYVVNCTDPFFF